MDKAVSRNYQLLNENLSASGELFPFGTMVRKAPKAPKTIQTVAIAFDSQPELDGKAFNAEETIDFSCRMCVGGIKLELTWRSCPDL